MISLIVHPDETATMFAAGQVYLPEPDPESVDDLFEVVMLNVLREGFEEWLASRGLKLARIPQNPTSIPTFTTTPTDERVSLCHPEAGTS
jgi:hypothetical protein